MGHYFYLRTRYSQNSQLFLRNLYPDMEKKQYQNINKYLLSINNSKTKITDSISNNIQNKYVMHQKVKNCISNELRVNLIALIRNEAKR